MIVGTGGDKRDGTSRTATPTDRLRPSHTSTSGMLNEEGEGLSSSKLTPGRRVSTGSDKKIAHKLNDALEFSQDLTD